MGINSLLYKGTDFTRYDSNIGHYVKIKWKYFKKSSKFGGNENYYWLSFSQPAEDPNSILKKMDTVFNATCLEYSCSDYEPSGNIHSLEIVISKYEIFKFAI